MALLRVEVFPLQTLLLLEQQAGRALARQPEPLAALAVRPALRALLALRLLLGACLDKVEAAVAVALLAQVEQAALEVVALAAVAVVQHAVHIPLAPVVSAVMDGH